MSTNGQDEDLLQRVQALEGYMDKAFRGLRLVSMALRQHEEALERDETTKQMLAELRELLKELDAARIALSDSNRRRIGFNSDAS